MRPQINIVFGAFLSISSVAHAEDVCEGFLSAPRNSSLVPQETIQLGIDCLKTAIVDFQRLSKSISTEIQNGLLEVDVPVGAIVAFDRPQGCPEGWSDVDASWTGKTLVVATEDTNNKYGFRRTGGAETHTLEVDEMPPHDHGGIWGGDGSRAAMGNPPNDFHASGYVQIRSDGEGKPHNNMPPYVALFFCKKMK